MSKRTHHRNSDAARRIRERHRRRTEWNQMMLTPDWIRAIPDIKVGPRLSESDLHKIIKGQHPFSV